jgi:hypothetical protein
VGICCVAVPAAVAILLPLLPPHLSVYFAVAVASVAVAIVLLNGCTGACFSGDKVEIISTKGKGQQGVIKVGQRLRPLTLLSHSSRAGVFVCVCVCCVPIFCALSGGDPEEEHGCR